MIAGNTRGDLGVKQPSLLMLALANWSRTFVRLARVDDHLVRARSKATAQKTDSCIEAIELYVSCAEFSVGLSADHVQDDSIHTCPAIMTVWKSIVVP